MLYKTSSRITYYQTTYSKIWSTFSWPASSINLRSASRWLKTSSLPPFLASLNSSILFVPTAHLSSSGGIRASFVSSVQPKSDWWFRRPVQTGDLSRFWASLEYLLGFFSVFSPENYPILWLWKLSTSSWTKGRSGNDECSSACGKLLRACRKLLFFCKCQAETLFGCWSWASRKHGWEGSLAWTSLLPSLAPFWATDDWCGKLEPRAPFPWACKCRSPGFSGCIPLQAWTSPRQSPQSQILSPTEAAS